MELQQQQQQQDPNLISLQHSHQTSPDEFKSFFNVFAEEAERRVDPFKYLTPFVFHTVIRKIRRLFFSSQQNLPDRETIVNEVIHVALGPFLTPFLRQQDLRVDFSICDDLVSCFLDIIPHFVKNDFLDEHVALAGVLENLVWFTNDASGAVLFANPRCINFLLDLLRSLLRCRLETASVLMTICNVLQDNDEAEEIFNTIVNQSEDVGDLFIKSLESRPCFEQSNATAALQLIYYYYIRNQNNNNRHWMSVHNTKTIVTEIFRYTSDRNFPKSKSFIETAASVLNQLDSSMLFLLLPVLGDSGRLLIPWLESACFEADPTTRGAEPFHRNDTVHDAATEPAPLASLLYKITGWGGEDDNNNNNNNNEKKNYLLSAEECVRLLTPRDRRSASMKKLETIIEMLYDSEIFSFFVIPEFAIALSALIGEEISSHGGDDNGDRTEPTQEQKQNTTFNTKIFRVINTLALNGTEASCYENTFEYFFNYIGNKIPLRSRTVELSLLRADTAERFLAVLENSGAELTSIFDWRKFDLCMTRRNIVEIVLNKCDHFISSFTSSLLESTAENVVLLPSPMTSRDQEGYLPTELNEFIRRFASAWHNHPTAWSINTERMLELLFMSLLPNSTGSATAAVLNLIASIFSAMKKEREGMHSSNRGSLKNLYPQIPLRRAWASVHKRVRLDLFTQRRVNYRGDIEDGDEKTETQGYSRRLKQELIDLFKAVSDATFSGEE